MSKRAAQQTPHSLLFLGINDALRIYAARAYMADDDARLSAPLGDLTPAAKIRAILAARLHRRLLIISPPSGLFRGIFSVCRRLSPPVFVRSETAQTRSSSAAA